MRWLPRLRHDKTADARPNPDPSPAEDRELRGEDRQLPAGDTARHTADPPAGAARPAGPAHWRRLPPLAPTVRQPPLTLAAAVGVLADAVDRPLIHPPGRRVPAVDRYADAAGNPVFTAEAGAAREVEPVAGRVTGLIAVRPEAP